MKHVHADLIKQWVEDPDGIQIEVLIEGNDTTGVWVNCMQPTWHVKYEYRIKPKPVADTVVRMRLDCHSTDDVVIVYIGNTSKIRSMAQIGKPDPAKMEALLREMVGAYPGVHWTRKEQIEKVLGDVTV